MFSFVQEMHSVSFFEALKYLAERQGIPLPKRTEYADADTRLRAAIFEMHELAGQAFRDNLAGPHGSEAREYLARRGVSDEMIATFAVGYSDRSGQLTRLFQSKGFTEEQLQNSGLILKRQDGSGWFDRFRNRLMFPIHNEMGKIIGFGGRALSDADEPKYLNSPETPIYKKSFVLYNLHRAKEGIRKDDRSILVEGYMDVIGVYAAGVKEVVASCGTALTNQQVQALKRHSGRIVVNFDPDAAGSNAAERSIQMLLDEGMHIRILELEGELDPDEYCKENGAEAYRTALDKAKGYFYWLADRARARFDMRDAEGRVAAFQFLLPAIQRLGDKIERVAVVNDVASYLGVDAGLVLEQFRKAAAERQDKKMKAPVEPVTFVEQSLLVLLLDSAEARERFVPELRGMAALDRMQTRNIFRALVALHESGGPFGYAELDARLEDADRGRLASIALSGDTELHAVSLEQGEACVANLRLQDRQSELAVVKGRIKDAERAGNMTEALRLMEEYNRLSEQIVRVKEPAGTGVVQ